MYSQSGRLWSTIAWSIARAIRIGIASEIVVYATAQPSPIATRRHCSRQRPRRRRVVGQRAKSGGLTWSFTCRSSYGRADEGEPAGRRPSRGKRVGGAGGWESERGDARVLQRDVLCGASTHGVPPSRSGGCFLSLAKKP